MSWYRKNPIFAIALTVCAALALGEIALIYERYAAARAAAKQLEQKRTELRSMADVKPPPTREVAGAIEADLGRARHALEKMQGELKGHGPAAERIHGAKVPAARTDAYFDLATFVERLRAMAKQDGVDLRPEAARFGFAAYANEGPEADRIEAVFHQRLIAEYVVQSLLDARPRALLSVKRERALTKAEREQRDAALATTASGGGTPDQAVADLMTVPEGPDYFAIDPSMSVRVPNYVDTTPLRLVFVGQTASLRNLLNKLATFELPVLVREVEVEPASNEDTTSTQPEDAPGAPAAAPAEPAAPSIVLNATPATPAAAARKPAPRSTAAPLVEKPFSKFTVTVEYVDLITPPANTPDGNNGAAPATPNP